MLCSPLLAQSHDIKKIHVNTLADMAELLDRYQERFIKGSLTRIELDYAHQWLCPKFPDIPETHLCNSSVVGTSDEAPDMDGGNNSQLPLKPKLDRDKISDSFCIKCLLKN